MGGGSLVARLTGNSQQEPFAELWVGAHPSAPSIVTLGEEEVRLDRLISFYPEQILGSRVVSRFGRSLPFLFKILSVGAPLSIQLHPDRMAAQRLHRERPALYPDPNHKPEVGIALSDVHLLYGFRPWPELQERFSAVPEFAHLLEEATLADLQDAPSEGTLHRALQELFSATDDQIEQVCLQLFDRLGGSASSRPEEEWILRLGSAYPKGDVGLFFFYLLNFVTLAPGEAIFIEPGVPHAYLSGDLAECMANSDNVVRAGLTPKQRDAETLLQLLYLTPIEKALLEAERTTHTHLYHTGAEEFVVEVLRPNVTRLHSDGVVQILFSLDGEGSLAGVDEETLPFVSGDAFLLPALSPYVDITVDSGRVFRVTVP